MSFSHESTGRWDDLLRASREGFASIHPDNFLRFRWFGIYQQRPKTDPYFMLRLKLPGGQLNAVQLRAVAEGKNAQPGQ